MKRTIAWKMAVVISVILLPTLVFASKLPDDVQKAKVMHKAYRMRIPFIENRGQIENNNVGFYAKTFGGTLFVGKNGTLTYSFPGENNTGVVIKEILTDNKVEVTGLDPSPTKVNYFKGKDQSKWKTNIPSYNSVSLGEIYKGVNLELKAYGNNVEKLFTVSPGENPEVIKIKLNGAKELKVNEKGELEVITELGPVKFTKPKAYQEIDGKRVEVNVSYNIQGLGFRDQGTGENDKIQMTNVKLTNSSIPQFLNPQSDTPTSLQHSSTPSLHEFPTTPDQQLVSYSFRVGDYNEAFPLTIDPLLASTYIGVNGNEYGKSLIIDGSGNVYITGSTPSSSYPTTLGAYDESWYAGSDVFISKFNSDLSTLVASTFLGGGSNDEGRCLALDGSGYIYVTGLAVAPSDFPTTPGAYRETGGGVFVSKLDTDLTTLPSSTFIGNGEATFMALDENDNVYVVGFTAATDYPTTPGAYDKSHNDDYDVFISKLNNNLTSLLASTYIGGSWRDIGYSLVLNENCVYVTGYTWGGSTPYPTTGAYDESWNGGADVFISKLDSTLSSLLASTFLGGTADDEGYSLARDGCGNIYVTGTTGSTDYPTTPDAYDTSHNYGSWDVFVSKLDSTLSFLFTSSFIGGSGEDRGQSLTFDKSGNVYVTGSTASSDYPTPSGAYDESWNGNFDVFVSKLKSNLSSPLLGSTYIGGAIEDRGNALSLDGSGNVYVTGWTNSSGYPTSTGAYDDTYYGDAAYDVFVSKLDKFLSADSGFLSGTSGFLSDNGVSFAFDADKDGILDVGCTQLLLCEGQIVEVDIWVTGWDSTVEGDVESIDYYFNWDPDLLEVQSVSCNDSLWDITCNEPTPPGSGEYNLQVSSSSGVSGPDMKLHTITFKVKDIPVPTTDHITAGLGISGFIDPVGGSNYTNVADGDVTIDTICGAEPIECTEENPCDMLESDDICPDTATITDDSYDYGSTETTFCEGDTITVYHTKKGYYSTEVVGQIDNMCSSVCFNECFNDCTYVEQQGCYLTCVKGCTNGVCPDWAEPEVCNEYQNRIDCNITCYNNCYYSYNGETQTSCYNKRCGFTVNEAITVRADAGNDCEGDLVSEYELTGAGTAAISIPLPLAIGIYDICAGTILIKTVTVQSCGEPVCTLSIPTNSFLADRGIDNTLSVNLSNIDAGGNYSLSLKRWEDDEHTIPMDIPASLNVPTQTSVEEDGSIAFDLDTTNPQDIDGQSHWANVIIWAEGLSTSCGASFDFDIRNISARADCGSDDYFSVSETVYGRAFLGLDPGTSYPLYVVDETSWTDGMTIPERVSGSEVSFTTDGSGDMACGTVMWNNAQADPLPAQFDIVIDVNSNGLFDEGTDYLDGKTGAGFGIYTDTDEDSVPDIEDNCWEVSNPYQLDSDGDCPDPPYTSDPQCGDICEPDNQCQADFDNDGNVYPSDLSVFLGEYGRTDCLTNPPCQADFDDDGNVYPSDLSVFLAEYGRTDCLE